MTKTQKVTIAVSALLGFVGLGYLVVSSLPKAAVADSADYTVAVTAQATGHGTLSVELGELFTGSFAIAGTTADSITVRIDAVAADRLTDAAAKHKLQGAHVAAVSGEGDVKGRLTVVVTTPFGALTVYDQPFEFGTDTADKE